ncbi:ankyrin repeat domain-containing protein 52 [Seiridium cupressi]
MHDQYLGELYRIDAKQCRENGVPWALRWAAWEGAKPAFEASIASLDAIGINSTDVVRRFFDRDHDDCCEYDFGHYPETYLDRRAEFVVHMEFLDEHDEHGLLNVCCIRGHLELVKLLLAKSANFNGANGRGLTAISYASNEDVARVLVEAGATFELQGDDSPLRYIYLMVQYFSGGLDDEYIDKWVDPTGPSSALKYLLQQGLESGKIISSDYTRHGFHALVDSVHRNQPELVKLLLENRATPNLRYPNGDAHLVLNDALHQANVVVTRLLELADVKVDSVASHQDNYTLANIVEHEADYQANLTITKLLLQAGAEVNSVPGSQDISALTTIVKYDGRLVDGLESWLGVLEDIIRLTDDVNKDVDRKTPLYWAVQNGLVNTAALLIKQGATLKRGGIHVDKDITHASLLDLWDAAYTP